MEVADQTGNALSGPDLTHHRAIGLLPQDHGQRRQNQRRYDTEYYDRQIGGLGFGPLQAGPGRRAMGDP
ncbi:unnamed protein product [Clonostachys rosea]|uniref:Uncharacterized protein n=1 Tax=Bionectria ochroleuca TaxID=29856 RepID=A0ABY6UXJ2_BIOOC|nr:unnamed protein product [Clonostachys rosea]